MYAATVLIALATCHYVGRVSLCRRCAPVLGTRPYVGRVSLCRMCVATLSVYQMCVTMLSLSRMCATMSDACRAFKEPRWSMTPCPTPSFLELGTWSRRIPPNCTLPPGRFQSGSSVCPCTPANGQDGVWNAEEGRQKMEDRRLESVEGSDRQQTVDWR